MARRVGVVHKTTRIGYVLEAVESGHSTIDKIVSCVGKRIRADQEEQSIKRRIQEDLDALYTDQKIQKRFFKANGEEFYPDELESDDKPKRFNVTYSIPGADIPGQKIVTSAGGRISSVLATMPWKISREIGDAVSPSMAFLVGDYLTVLSIPDDELPANIVLGKTPKVLTDLPNRETLKKDIGLRTLSFYIPEMTVSAPKEAGRVGHCCISWKNSKRAVIKDLGSTNGTKYLTLTEKDKQDLLAKWLSVNGRTPHLNDLSIGNKDDWHLLKPNEEESVKSPFVIKLSRWFALIT